MRPRSVTHHPAFQSARSWMATREGQPPHRWLPRGLERLDDTWLAAHPLRGPRHPPSAAFEALPAELAERARAACGADAARRCRLPAPLCEACARWCWGDLVDLPPLALQEPALVTQIGDASQDEEAAALLPRFSPSTLIGAMSLAGLPDLGGLLALAPERTAAVVCSRLPAAWRERVWQHRTGSSRPDRKALKQLNAVTSATDPTEVLFVLGANHFAPLLAAHPLPRLQTAQLLPVPVARHLMGSTSEPHESALGDLLGALDEAADGSGAPRP